MYADCYKILGNVETKKKLPKKFNVTEKIEILNAHINVSCDVMVVDWTFFFGVKHTWQIYELEISERVSTLRRKRLIECNISSLYHR